ncbi:MAG: hypothetical protein U0796_00180 [Gemmatales bacterium]
MVLAKLKSRSLLFNRRADCTKYGYDSIGQQTLRIDGRSLRTTYVFDAEGKITGWKYQDQTRATQVYDAVGQRTQIQDWTGRYTYSFDAVGRPLLASNSFAKRITYGYDAAGQRVRMREPDGGRFTYWYDGAGQNTRLLNPFLESTTFTYDVAGRRMMQKLANRVRASYSYDAADRLATLANVRADGTYVSRFDYAYDNTINKARVIEANGDRVTLNYDTIYQLRRERRSGANAYDTTYVYDNAQNRRLMISSGQRSTYACDAADQYIWLENSLQRTTFAYDANGNLLFSGGICAEQSSYTYDCDNRLIIIFSESTPICTFSYYSQNNQPVSRVHYGAASHTTYDDETAIASHTESNETELCTFAPRWPNYIISTHNAVSQLFSFDSNGTIRNCTDIIGDISGAFLSDSFGVVLTNSMTTSYKYKGAYSMIYVNDCSFRYRHLLYYPRLGRYSSLPYDIGGEPESFICKYCLSMNPITSYYPIDSYSSSYYPVMMQIPVPRQPEPRQPLPRQPRPDVPPLKIFRPDPLPPKIRLPLPTGNFIRDFTMLFLQLEFSAQECENYYKNVLSKGVLLIPQFIEQNYSKNCKKPPFLPLCPESDYSAINVCNNAIAFSCKNVLPPIACGPCVPWEAKWADCGNAPGYGTKCSLSPKPLNDNTDYNVSLTCCACCKVDQLTGLSSVGFSCKKPHWGSLKDGRAPGYPGCLDPIPSGGYEQG